MKKLGQVLASWRWELRLTVREAAEQIGLKPSTYSRLERGYSIDGATLATVLAWLLQRDPPKASLDVDVVVEEYVEVGDADLPGSVGVRNSDR